jgi:hypothetical protein
MSEVEQRMDARGNAVRPAGAEQDAARAAAARRNAWVLGGLAALFYVGYIVWMFVRSSGTVP